jgi:hypothetical protein
MPGRASRSRSTPPEPRRVTTQVVAICMRVALRNREALCHCEFKRRTRSDMRGDQRGALHTVCMSGSGTLRAFLPSQHFRQLLGAQETGSAH